MTDTSPYVLDRKIRESASTLHTHTDIECFTCLAQSAVVVFNAKENKINDLIEELARIKSENATLRKDHEERMARGWAFSG
jgi:hypothetical protein